MYINDDWFNVICSRHTSRMENYYLKQKWIRLHASFRCSLSLEERYPMIESRLRSVLNCLRNACTWFLISFRWILGNLFFSRSCLLLSSSSLSLYSLLCCSISWKVSDMKNSIFWIVLEMVNSRVEEKGERYNLRKNIVKCYWSHE